MLAFISALTAALTGLIGFSWGSAHRPSLPAKASPQTLPPAAQPRNAPMPSDALDRLSPRSRQAWEAHLRESQKTPLQAGCGPYYLAPKGLEPGEPAKGSVILLHGFTACAQQSDGLAPLLAGDGYHVFVPRLSGHGLPAHFDGQHWHDDLSDMPQLNDYQRYRDFASQLPALVRDLPGLHVIAGVSLGGTVAASATLQAPGLFDRTLLMTPLFDIVEPQNRLVPLLFTFAPKARLNWGSVCDQERLKHRGGYCEFSLSNIRAMQQFGRDTLTQLDHLDSRTQMVGVEGDGAASNGAIRLAATRLPFAHHCLYEQGTSHSMLSPYDNQHEDKFWVPRLQSQIRRFVREGRYFDQAGPSMESGFQRCLSR